MRRLFLKIFLSIMLAVLAAFFVGMAIAAWARPAIFARLVSQTDSDSEDNGQAAGGSRSHRGWRGGHLVSQAHVAEWLLARYGPGAAADYAESLRSTGAEAYVLDGQAIEVRDRNVPPPLRRIAQQALEADEIQFAEDDKTVIAGVKIQAADGEAFVFAVSVPSPRSLIATYRFWKSALTLTPVVITLGIVCYFVARYLSNPVLKLRKAVRCFADGDLTHRVAPSVGRRQDELGELARDFDHMAERIAGLITSQRRLLQDISHELRSPLARQTVAIELARRDAGSQAEESLDRAAREGERLSELVGELLTLTRLESGGPGIERAPVELDTLVHDIVKDADFEAQSRDCSVRLSAIEPCVVNGVAELLRRAIENVVRNAIGYTAPGSEVDVSLRSSGAEVLIQVRDHGPGVPEAELGEIFRAFHRVSRGRERQSGGVGLGLAITERVVAAQGGRVSAHNASDGGLVVELRLPLV